MKKTVLSLLLFFVCMTANGQGGSSRSQSYSEKPSSFAPSGAATGRVSSKYSFIGRRLDINMLAGVSLMQYKPIDSYKTYVAWGASATGYFVFKNRKNALGAGLDFSHNQSMENATHYYSVLFGPAYSYNFSPFSKVHCCLDISAGYMFRRNFVTSNIFIDEIFAMNKVNQHTLGIKAGISLFKWSGDFPSEYRLTVKAPIGNSLFMKGNNKTKTQNAFGNCWEITLSFGARFGRY